MTVSKALKLTVNTSSNLTEAVKIILKEVVLVKDLTLKCSSHLIIQIIKVICRGNLSTVSQLDKSSLEILKGHV